MSVEIEPGLTYREELGERRTLTCRECGIFKEGESEPVSSLELYSFQHRFGGVAVQAEGIGGVETVPAFRRKGLVSRLIEQAIAGAASRVNLFLVSDSIMHLYERFDCVTCMANSTLKLEVRDVELSLKRNEFPMSGGIIREYREVDLPRMVTLYNQAHDLRPWTHVRKSNWNRIYPDSTWNPGSEAIVLQDGPTVVGYAIFRGRYFGHEVEPRTVQEMVASDIAAANRLLQEMAKRALEDRISHFVIHEPADSVVGIAARAIGCEVTQAFPPSGGMMGRILNRQALLGELEPELRRRLQGADAAPLHEQHFGDLMTGHLIQEDSTLLRLLLGYWSFDDVSSLQGLDLPEKSARLCRRWFPGGGNTILPIPYAHTLDRY